MKVNKKTIRGVLFICSVIFIIFFSFNKAVKSARAQGVWGENEEVKEDIEEGSSLSATDPILIIARIINLFFGFLGFLAVLLIMWGGYTWMMSRGNADEVKKAKNTLKNTAIGLAIILSSYAIVSYLLSKAVGTATNPDPSGGKDGNTSTYLGAVGEHIIESHYPSRDQVDVSRNTKIAISFREEMDIDSLIEDKKTGTTYCKGADITCGKLNFKNVRIYPSSKGDSCEFDGTTYIKCDTNNVVDVNVSTSNGEVFVFQPSDYLGNTIEQTKYTVYLSGSILKADKNTAFGGGGYYSWDFTVSNKLDLTPPKVKSIFPFPDNEKDIYDITEAVEAEWALDISALPSAGQKAETAISIKSDVSTSKVETEGEFNLASDGTFSIVIKDKGTAKVSFSDQPEMEKSITDESTVDNKKYSIDLNYGLMFKIKDFFSAGNSWEVAATAKKDSDYIEINGNRYKFGGEIAMAETTEDLAVNIAEAINKEESFPVHANPNGSQVILTAKIGGEKGNAINIVSSFDDIVITKKEGVNSNTEPQQKGALDQAVNAVIQINFDEAIDPLTINNFVAIRGSAGDIEGDFLYSNQYKTVEFKPANPCGTNACGEEIYCLPGSENIEIALKAGELEKICESDKDCTDYPHCGEAGAVRVCKNDEWKNFPLALFNSGIVDMGSNSLDGNSNDDAQGPQSQSGNVAYNENSPVAEAQGDDYRWSFYTSNSLILSAPEIIERAPSPTDTSVYLKEPLTAQFNRLMMSSSLSTGQVEIEGKTHNRIELEALTSNSVGYWVEKENIDIPVRDGYDDQTIVIIKHDAFDAENSYKANIGSGVKDIYQNCYNPSKGPYPCEAGSDCPEAAP